MTKNSSNEQSKDAKKNLNNSSADNSRKKLGPGIKAPDFELLDDAGAKISLASFAGKKLVLYFYPKDDTSGCTKEAIDFNGLRGEFKKAGAAILGVSPDSVASHAKFKVKHKLDLTLAADESKRGCLKPMAYGPKKACTAGNIWGSSARPSSSTRTARSQLYGTR